jgi:hypothetical protein
MDTMIETRNCSLDTLAVTIQALHVSGKQMTLAVFRQLPVALEQEFKESQPWGTVRYAIKDEGDRWLVFSADGRLYRRVLATEPDWWIVRQAESAPAHLAKEQIKHEKKLQQLMDRIESAKRFQEVGPCATWLVEIEKRNEEVAICKSAWIDQMGEAQGWVEASATETKRAAIDAALASTLPQLFIAV